MVCFFFDDIVDDGVFERCGRTCCRACSVPATLAVELGYREEEEDEDGGSADGNQMVSFLLHVGIFGVNKIILFVRFLGWRSSYSCSV